MSSGIAQFYSIAGFVRQDGLDFRVDDRCHRWRQRIGVCGPRCCAGLLGLPWLAGVPSGQEIAVSCGHGQLTVKVDQVPITTLAPVLEEVLGWRVRLAGGLSRERIRVHIEADDLYAGLARLFRAYNYSLVTPPGTDRRAGLLGVFVYAGCDGRFTGGHTSAASPGHSPGHGYPRQAAHHHAQGDDGQPPCTCRSAVVEFPRDLCAFTQQGFPPGMVVPVPGDGIPQAL